MRGWKYLLSTLLGCLLLSTAAQAHQPSTAWLDIELLSKQGKKASNSSSLIGSWHIDLIDLELAVGLDLDGDSEITWGELRRQENAVFRYALSRLDIKLIKPSETAEGGAEVVAGSHPTEYDCKIGADTLLVAQRSEGNYAVLKFGGHCPSSPDDATLSIDYDLLFDQDRGHQAHLKFTQRETIYADIIGVNDRLTEIPLAAGEYKGSFWDNVGRYLIKGIEHLLVGYDHILFLLCLILPLALLPKPLDAEPQLGRYTPRVPPIVKLVTAFTLGHSITLIAATMGWIRLPVQPVEIAIAISVLLAALNNVFGVIKTRQWLLALMFGLLHGFGFAAVLADISLPTEQLVASLLGFNLGVEFGQLIVVAILFPLLLILPFNETAKKRLMQIGSLVIAALAVWWIVERLGWV